MSATEPKLDRECSPDKNYVVTYTMVPLDLGLHFPLTERNRLLFQAITSLLGRLQDLIGRVRFDSGDLADAFPVFLKTLCPVFA